MSAPVTTLHLARSLRLRSVAEVIDDLDTVDPGDSWHGTGVLRTGFDVIDRVLDGGLRSSDLALIGGLPGSGKTIACLQMARAMARQGARSLYVCYEHDPEGLLGRLLCLELGELASTESPAELDRLRPLVLEAVTGRRSLAQLHAAEELVARACGQLATYHHNLCLVRGSGTHTGLAQLGQLAEGVDDQPTVLFVDYLQKVAAEGFRDEAEKVTVVVEGLKELALSRRLAVVAIAAADLDGIRSPRLRLHHLRGSSALAYECDIAIMLNDKHRAVAPVHVTYDPVRAESFKHQVVFTVEKNRGGPTPVDVEFRKHFSHYRFDPRGSYLVEKLIE